MQLSNGPTLLRTYAQRTHVTVRRLLHGVTPRRTWWQRLAENATTRRAIQLADVLIDALYEIGQHGFHNRFSVNFRLGNTIKGILVRL